MTEFITPKTNWIANDFINIEDYNRILNNLWYVAINRIRPYYNVDSTYDDLLDNEVTYSDYPTADRWNLIENKLSSLAELTDGIVVFDKKIFYPGGDYINFEELNRIENTILELYNLHERIRRAMVTLPFTLGNYGGF